MRKNRKISRRMEKGEDRKGDGEEEGNYMWEIIKDGEMEMKGKCKKDVSVNVNELYKCV
jgi:hypothetical protein